MALRLITPETEQAEYIGKTITAASLVKSDELAEAQNDKLPSVWDDKLYLTFGDGQRIAIWDNGQQCCEIRYITTDDDMQSLVGHRLVSITTKPVQELPADDGGVYHEIEFLEIATDAGFVTLVSHNKHNGYYAGFNLTISEVVPQFA